MISNISSYLNDKSIYFFYYYYKNCLEYKINLIHIIFIFLKINYFNYLKKKINKIIFYLKLFANNQNLLRLHQLVF